ncbi:hypothetical protein ACJX0J_021309, partial [Zea mays]
EQGHGEQASNSRRDTAEEQYYEMIISLVFVYYVSFFCNIMSFDIFSHIAWKQLIDDIAIFSREVGNIGRVIIMFIHNQLKVTIILVGITGGDMLNLDIVNRIFCFCAPRNYAVDTFLSTSTFHPGHVLCLSCVPGASC